MQCNTIEVKHKRLVKIKSLKVIENISYIVFKNNNIILS